MMNDHHTQLTEAGRTRRAAILNMAAGELLATHRRRRRRRTFTAAAALAVVMAGCAVAALSIGPRVFHASSDSIATARMETGPTDAQPDEAVVQVHRDESVDPAVRIVRVHTDERATQRYVVQTEARPVRIDDETLLTLLASIDRPAGLIHIDGETRLTRDVTDDPDRF